MICTLFRAIWYKGILPPCWHRNSLCNQVNDEFPGELIPTPSSVDSEGPYTLHYFNVINHMSLPILFWANGLRK